MGEIVTTTYGSDEVRAFGDGDSFNAIPVMIDSSVGSIPVGTALGQITSTGKYAPYNDAHSDGTNVCSGFLGVDMTNDYPSLAGIDLVSDMWISGNFVLSKLTAAGLDSNGIADLGARSVPGRDLLIVPNAG